MKPALAALSTFLLCFSVMYVMFSVAAWDVNPGEWRSEMRMMMCFIQASIGGPLAIASYIVSAEK